ncbi:MAG: glutathione peroxidase [Candidatus Cloacimonadota bacterium]|nr:MAG: glutathione peroxidase [Candidatus Cloacimonadota bacterium]
MLENREGQLVPEVSFKVFENGGFKEISTKDLFAKKTVAVFSLPGAFTPTCSSFHVPRYNDLAGVLKENGIDEIVCVSVNDTFIMNSWKQDQKAENVTFIPDGNGEFSEGMGMLVDKSAIGFGKRSWRYSMIVKDSKIEKMFIEEDIAGDPFKVSDADTMLNFLNPNAKKPEYITIFSKEGCSHCVRAKDLLNSKKLAYEEVLLNDEITNKSLEAVSGNSSTPQIFIGGKLIGTADDLEAYLK